MGQIETGYDGYPVSGVLVGKSWKAGGSIRRLFSHVPCVVGVLEAGHSQDWPLECGSVGGLGFSQHGGLPGGPGDTEEAEGLLMTQPQTPLASLRHLSWLKAVTRLSGCRGVGRAPIPPDDKSVKEQATVLGAQKCLLLCCLHLFAKSSACPKSPGSLNSRQILPSLPSGVMTGLCTFF